MTRPRIDVVSPLFNEEANFTQFIASIEHELLTYEAVDWHFILVDDGSTDHTWEMIERQCRISPRFRGIRLSRNFGFHAAVAAGIEHSSGDAVCDDARRGLAGILARHDRRVCRIVDARRRHRLGLAPDPGRAALAGNGQQRICRRLFADTRCRGPAKIHHR